MLDHALRSMKEYSRLQTTIANIPYAAMALLGAATIACGFTYSPWALASAGGYVAYAIAGTVWTMVFICPYCAYYATRGCPCGYGTISARLSCWRTNCSDTKGVLRPIELRCWIKARVFANAS